jgi:SAM-dependent methyltransferase
VSNDRYFADNLANWNDRVPIHAGPDGYRIQRYIEDPSRISEMVEFDRRYLGDVAGKTLFHPQCHIGTDTVSWARLGAHVTGIDFSAPALGVARDLAARIGVDARFVESDLYASPDVLDAQFDIVYTGVGAINWLPDIDRWARVMAQFTKPGGEFYMREGHPILWSLDYERDDDLLVLTHPYFQTEDPITWDEPDSYLGTGTIRHTTSHEWNHGMGEIITALINAGFRIDLVEEHRFLEWVALPHMIEENERYRLPDRQADLAPLMYSIRATRVPNTGQ